MTMRTPIQPESTTAPVLAAMQVEIEALMGSLTGFGDRRAAEAAASPHELAIMLRLGSRLARLGGWVLAYRGGCGIDHRDAGAALRRADSGDIDSCAAVGALAGITERVDRLAAQALRLDRLLSADAKR